MVIEGQTALTIKVAASAVVVDPAGVTITGPKIVIDGQTMTQINSGPGSPVVHVDADHWIGVGTTGPVR